MNRRRAGKKRLCFGSKLDKEVGSEKSENFEVRIRRLTSMISKGTAERSKWWNQRFCEDNTGKWAWSSRQESDMLLKACVANKKVWFYPERYGELWQDFKQRSDIIQLAIWCYESWWWDTNWQQPVLRIWRIVLANVSQI